MTDAFQTAKVKLVTIVASFQIGDRIANDLRTLGVSGYTKSKTDGWGAHGTRQYGLVDGANVRFETLVLPELARTILAHIAVHFAGQALIAFALDVEAVPVGHFA